MFGEISWIYTIVFHIHTLFHIHNCFSQRRQNRNTTEFNLRKQATDLFYIEEEVNGTWKTEILLYRNNMFKEMPHN